LFAVFRCGAFLAFRIGDAGVEHIDERETEAIGDLPNLGDGQWSLVELSLVEARFDDIPDEIVDALWGGTIKTA
jgi:hypothetical protein